MRVVGIRELKSRLSEYVRAVRRGERVLITDRGQVVARIVPADETEESAAFDHRVAELARRGMLRPGAPNSPALYPRMRPLRRPGARSSRELLDAEREER